MTRVALCGDDYVWVDDQVIAIDDVEVAAHQDDVAYLYRRGIYDVPPQDARTRALAKYYRDVLAEIVVLQEKAAARRVASCSGHAVARTSEAWGFTGPVASGDDEWPPAHGNVGYTDTCRCGAQRHTLVNGMHAEIGPWR